LRIQPKTPECAKFTPALKVYLYGFSLEKKRNYEKSAGKASFSIAKMAL
jgi:hypothetical protein